VAVVLASGVATFACMWGVQAILLDTRNWFAVINSQLAANAFNRITPGGGATGTALQAHMLSDAGFDLPEAATAVTVQSLLSTAAVLSMPIFAVPAIIAGTQVPSGLLQAAWVGAVLFVLMAVIGVLLFATNRPVCAVGAASERVARFLHLRRRPRPGLGDRMLEARDAIKTQIGAKWPQVVGLSLGRWCIEYAMLLIALHAIDANPNPALVLLSFVGANVLGLLPFTPGGLGFVEAGLTATLVLAGVTADAAILATLVYRLVTYWLPLPIGFAASLVYRHRYPRVHASTG
jgi:uncharacterized protein (TIRG00374 family)